MLNFKPVYCLCLQKRRDIPVFHKLYSASQWELVFYYDIWEAEESLDMQVCVSHDLLGAFFSVDL